MSENIRHIAQPLRDLDILTTTAQVVGWLGERGAVRAYVAKAERAHYLRLLGGDTQQFEQANKFSNKKDENGDVEAAKE